MKYIFLLVIGFAFFSCSTLPRTNYNSSLETPDLKEKLKQLRVGMSEKEMLEIMGDTGSKSIYLKPYKHTVDGRVLMIDTVYGYQYYERHVEQRPGFTVTSAKEIIGVSLYFWEGHLIYPGVWHELQAPPGSKETVGYFPKKGDTWRGELDTSYLHSTHDEYSCYAFQRYLNNYKYDYDKLGTSGSWDMACKFNCRQFWDDGVDPCELETLREYWVTVEQDKIPEEYKKDIPKR